MTALLHSPPTARTTTEVVPFLAGDGLPLNLHHVTGPVPPTRGPVLLVHGAGVRADIFRPPEPVTVVDALLAEGWDVWLENWRASTDLPRNRWTLDQAALHDHPQAVRTVLDLTGSDTLKAVVHCQGSSSFVLSAVAGLLPQVETIVSNAMSLHPMVPRFSRFKIRRMAPIVATELAYADPHWGVTPPRRLLERALVRTVSLTHRECDNEVCHLVSFTYGSGRPALWSHENLSPGTHHWLRGEFGPVPMTFFAQMAASVTRGQLVSALPELVGALAGPPRTDARIVLLAGADNRCFLPESQLRTYDWLESYRPGHDALHVFPGYGHLDVFLGRYAARDTLPTILQELAT